MMKKLLTGATLVFALGQAAFASIPELIITTGANTTGVITGSAAAGGGGTVSYLNTNFGGWNISFLGMVPGVIGASSSPSLTPFGLEIQNFTAACVTGNCAALTVSLSDINFTQPVTGFQTTYSSTNTGAGASTSQTAWVGLGNSYFATTSLIGSIGPLTGTGGQGSVQGGPPAGPTAFSLTLEDTFAGCSGSNCVSYSSDGNLTGVPEPVGVVLFGTVLALCGSRLRRRKSA
jgi:hypothetical protein